MRELVLIAELGESIVRSVRERKLNQLRRQLSQHLRKMRHQIDSMAFELDAKFEGEPVDTRSLTDVGPPRGVALRDTVGGVVGEGDLPAVLDEERHAVGRKGYEPGGGVETCDDTIRDNMAPRCDNQVAGVLARNVEWQAVECLEAQTGKALASLLFDLHV